MAAALVVEVLADLVVEVLGAGELAEAGEMGTRFKSRSFPTHAASRRATHFMDGAPRFERMQALQGSKSRPGHPGLVIIWDS